MFFFRTICGHELNVVLVCAMRNLSYTVRIATLDRQRNGVTCSSAVRGS